MSKINENLKNIIRCIDVIEKRLNNLTQADSEKEIREKAISIVKHFGKEKQLIKAMEEMAELIQAITKSIITGNNKDNIKEEMADVYIMFTQLEFIYGSVDMAIVNQKLERTLNIIKSEEW